MSSRAIEYFRLPQDQWSLRFRWVAVVHILLRRVQNFNLEQEHSVIINDFHVLRSESICGEYYLELSTNNTNNNNNNKNNLFASNWTKTANLYWNSFSASQIWFGYTSCSMYLPFSIQTWATWWRFQSLWWRFRSCTWTWFRINVARMHTPSVIMKTYK